MIETLKDLKNLLKLCRQNGVTEINVGSVAFKLGEVPKVVSGEIEEVEEEDFLERLEAPILQEELVAFANGGDL